MSAEATTPDSLQRLTSRFAIRDPMRLCAIRRAVRSRSRRGVERCLPVPLLGCR